MNKRINDKEVSAAVSPKVGPQPAIALFFRRARRTISKKLFSAFRLFWWAWDSVMLVMQNPPSKTAYPSSAIGAQAGFPERGAKIRQKRPLSYIPGGEETSFLRLAADKGRQLIHSRPPY
jgi:hypothetical protein